MLCKSEDFSFKTPPMREGKNSNDAALGVVSKQLFGEQPSPTALATSSTLGLPNMSSTLGLPNMSQADMFVTMNKMMIQMQSMQKIMLASVNRPKV